MKRLLSCPRCSSDNLDMKKSRGVERIMILLSGKRKFRCDHCSYGFRAIDHSHGENAAGEFLPADARQIRF
jgi:transposase-like protein